MKNFRNNIIVFGGLKFLSLPLSLLLSRWMTNEFSEQDLYLFNTASAYVFILIPILTFGLPQLIHRTFVNATTTDQKNEVWSTAFYLRIASYCIGVLICGLIAVLRQELSFLLLLGVFTIQFIILFDSHIKSYLDATEQTWRFGVTDFLTRFFVIALLYAYAMLTKQNLLLIFVTCHIIIYLIGFLIDYIWNREGFELTAFSLKSVRNHSNSLIKISVSQIFVGTYLTLDKVILGYYTPSENSLNAYFNAYRIFDIFFLIIGIFSPVIASKIYTKYWVEAKNKHIMFLKAIAIQVVFGLGVVIGFNIIGNILLGFIDSQKLYPLSWDLIFPLSLSFVFMSAMYMVTSFNYFLHNESSELLVSIILFFIHLVLYFGLIVLFGPFGGAWATSIGFALLFFIKYALFVYDYNRKANIERSVGGEGLV